MKKNHCGGRLSFKTQLKIEYLLPYTGSRKVLENIPACDHNQPIKLPEFNEVLYIEDITRRHEDMTFIDEKIKVVSSSHGVMFCLVYSPKQKIVKFHARKQIGKSHVIDIFTIEDMENISLCLFQYLTLYYIINRE
jgi:hypothetical protein